MQRGAELILLSESISYTNSGANDVRIIRVKRFRNKCRSIANWRIPSYPCSTLRTHLEEPNSTQSELGNGGMVARVTV
jgi:hypothetical protein